MAYFADLTPYSYMEEYARRGLYNIGWLDHEHEPPVGNLPEAVIDKLWAFCRAPVVRTRGLHTCQLWCSTLSPREERLYVTYRAETLAPGSAEIRVFGERGRTYAAPDLIFHYVTDHRYRPPDEFVEAVLSGPQPGRDVYRKKLADLNMPV